MQGGSDGTEDIPALCLFPLTAPDGTPWAKPDPDLLRDLRDGLEQL